MSFGVRYHKIDRGQGLGWIAGTMMPAQDAETLQPYEDQLVFDEWVNTVNMFVDLTDPDAPILAQLPPPPSD